MDRSNRTTRTQHLRGFPRSRAIALAAGLAANAVVYAQPTVPLYFSLDIGSARAADVDPGDSIFDVGDVYEWSATALTPIGAGRDGVINDLDLLGAPTDPPPTYSDTAVACRFFDLSEFDMDAVQLSPVDLTPYFNPDAGDQDNPIRRQQVPPEEVELWDRFLEARVIAFSSDDNAICSLPGLFHAAPSRFDSFLGRIYGTANRDDEVMTATVTDFTSDPRVGDVVGSLDETSLHAEMAPNPSSSVNDDDDDVDALTYAIDPADARTVLFSADFDASYGLDPGTIYSWDPGTRAITALVSPSSMGLDPNTDIDAFEFAWIDHPFHGQILACLFSVDADAAFGLDPAAIFAWFNAGPPVEYISPSILLGVNAPTGELFRIDRGTGVGTSLGYLPTTDVYAMESTPGGEVLAISGNDVYLVDRDNPSASTVISTLPPSTTITNYVVTAMTFKGNDLYAAHHNGVDARFIRITDITGTPTVHEIGDTGIGACYGIAYQANSDTFFAVDRFSEGLGTIDELTGAFSASYSPGDWTWLTDSRSLCFDRDGTLFAAGNDDLLKIDPLAGTATATAYGPIGTPTGEWIGGLCCVPIDDIDAIAVVDRPDWADPVNERADFDRLGTDMAASTFGDARVWDGPGGWARTAVNDDNGNPSTNPMLPINAGGEKEAALTSAPGEWTRGIAFASDDYDDVEMQATVAFGQALQRPDSAGILVRANSLSDLANVLAYEALLTDGGDTATFVLRKRTGTTYTNLTDAPVLPPTINENLRITLRAQGDQISASLTRITSDGIADLIETPVDLSDEPGMQDSLSVTDGTYTQGRCALRARVSGNNAVYFDEVTARRLPEPACACDLNDDGTVDIVDLLLFLPDWFGTTTAADFNGDGQTNVQDLLALLACWFPASAGANCP